jgi:hypothetical protein
MQMADSSELMDLKVVELGDDITMEIPRGWTCHWTDNGEWWCGDEARDIGVFVRTEAFGPEAIGAAYSTSASGNARAIGDRLRSFLADNAIGEIETETNEFGEIIHAVVEHEEHGERIRTFRWYAVNGYADMVSLARFTLAAPAAIADDPELAALGAVFADQARKVGPGLFRAEDLRLLEERAFGPRIRLKVPALWNCDLVETDAWRCWPRRRAPGTFFVVADIKPVDDRTPDEIALGVPDIAGEIFKKAIGDVYELVDRRLSVPDQGGMMAFIVDNGEPSRGPDDDEPLRLYSWHYVKPLVDAVAIIHFRLMIEHSWLDTPAVDELVQAMDREISKARIT